MSSQLERSETEHFSAQDVPATPASPTDEFRPVPRGASAQEKTAPTWRVRFTPATDPNGQFGLEIVGEVVLGRHGEQQEIDDVINLNSFGAEALGVSRRHAMLRPTTTNLFIVDQGSTNGTYRNGRSVGSRTPYSLVDGDVITLGKLPLLVEVVERPSMPESQTQEKVDVTEALVQIAKAITSQLDLDDVLNQVADTARALTAAGETGIWLVDEDTGELLLEAQRGIGDDRIRRMRLSSDEDTLVGEVLRTTKPVRASRKPGEDEIKVKTGYLVEALVYVPITLGGITFGVLSATHREAGAKFSRRDERLLEAIGDFAAIAIQNARLYHRTDAALERRIKELSALNQLTLTLSTALDPNRVYEELVEQINRYWPVEGVRLYLLDEDKGRLHLHVSGDKDEEEGALHFPLGRGIVGNVVRTGKLTVANDVSEETHYAPDVDAPALDDPHTLVCVPLQVKERTVGALSLLNKLDGAFTQEDVSRLRAFSSPISTAVENARLYAESERRRRAMQATARTLPEPLIILDESGHLLVANDAAQRLLDTNMSELFEAVSSGVGRTTEVGIGEETYLSTAQHADGVGTIVVMQDITYVKELEEDRSDFMHALSHDMRNPLTSIIGYTQVMERLLPPDEQYDKFLQRIRMSADRMLEMVTQLLRTIDADMEEQIEREPCQLEPIMTKVVRDVEGVAMSKSIGVDVEVDGDPYDILADADRLYHAILNLVENAVKYSPAETKVTLAASFDREEATIEVRDEGPGIPESDLPHIFEKYYRGAQGSTHPGNGLGLAVVRSVVEAHGGSIAARNRPERGAQFTITLPAAATPSQPAA